MFKNIFCCHKRSEKTSNISIKIHIDVIDRMKNIVSISNVEEGGKLIGFITHDENDNYSYNVISYLDSGVLVDNSSIHIIPSGKYQRNLYNLITSEVDYSYEHMGTWHSHHCNGLNTLSKGDIDGYYDIVNREEYTPLYFIAILLINIKDDIDFKVYLFQKGEEKFNEIPKEKIIIEKTVDNKLNSVLQKIEVANFSERNKRTIEYSYEELRDILLNHKIIDNKEVVIDDIVKETLLADISWLKSNSLEYTATRTEDNYVCLNFLMDSDIEIKQLFYPILLQDRELFKNFSLLSITERINNKYEN